MSGFLPDLASWALRGGAGNSDGDDRGDESAAAASAAGDERPPLTAEEMRAQRLARMEMRLSEQQPPPQPEQEDPLGQSQPMDVDKEPEKINKKSDEEPTPMQVDNSTAAASASATKKPPPTKTVATGPAKPAPAASAPAASSSSLSSSRNSDSNNVGSPQKKKKAKSDNNQSSPDGKLQRKKEMLLKRVLGVRLKGGCLPLDAAVCEIDTESAEISVSTVAEILAERLFGSSSNGGAGKSGGRSIAASFRQDPASRSLIGYLGQCHRKAAEESKSMKQEKKNPKQELLDILSEIQRQVVSYAASCLMAPELSESAADADRQLADRLLASVTDVGSSITFGVAAGGTAARASANSFYYLLVEELLSQDETGALLDGIVAKVVGHLTKPLRNCESVLEMDGDGNAAAYVSALAAVCLHKRAALAVTRVDGFLLPPTGTPEATAQRRPPMPSAAAGGSLQANFLQQMLAGELRPYLGRSGPALEKDTVLGLCLRVGVPKQQSNTAFAPSTILRQSLDQAERATQQQRLQLKHHQDVCYQFIFGVIKGGPAARERVMLWFVDCLLVNTGAGALRPDPTKVSSTSLLLNTSVMLLRLCQPFVDDPSKQYLIDPGFVNAGEAHRGVFSETGDDAVRRLGDGQEEEGGDDVGQQDGAGDDSAMDTTTTMMTPVTAAAPAAAAADPDAPPTAAAIKRKAAVPYQPKNAFIPQCFFFCARSLHLGIVPGLAYHENLLRHISHAHWEITNNNQGDLQSDPHFSMLVSRQRCNEVALFEESACEQTLQFCNYMCRVLYDYDDDVMKTIPEDFVSDTCQVITGIAKLKARLLRHLDFRFVFSLVVKLLSAKYATMVRNYNLRAMLGDVLYELFLPPSGNSDHRDVPPSVYTDDLSAGGQTYLLSDATAQETLAPSLLLLYGEVEHTGYYDKMSHRAKIAELIKYLWNSSEHRPAFARITQDKSNFIKFANGIINETNTLIATVMQKLPEIREAQQLMKDGTTWSALSEDEQQQITSRLEDNEREVKHALPLCNKTLQMFGYLNTDPEIRSLFLLQELCPRLVQMLLHCLTKLVGSKGLELKVDNPEQYEFRPKEMLRDLAAIFALFAESEQFQVECAKSGCDAKLLRQAHKTCRKLNLLTGESLRALEALPDRVQAAADGVKADEMLLRDAPDEFLDEILSTFMRDPVQLPSGHYVDRSTITQHLLNDLTDPFNREPMTVDDIRPADELKERMEKWLQEQKQKAALSAVADASATDQGST